MLYLGPEGTDLRETWEARGTVPSVHCVNLSSPEPEGRGDSLTPLLANAAAEGPLLWLPQAVWLWPVCLAGAQRRDHTDLPASLEITLWPWLPLATLELFCPPCKC